MAKIQFENGTVVDFDGDPTPDDVANVAESLGFNAPAQSKGNIERNKTGPLSKFTRALLGSSQIEQMKTEAEKLNYIKSQPPQHLPQEDIRSYNERINAGLKPFLENREKDIISKGTMSQLDLPISAGLAMSGASAPVQTAKLLAKFGVIDTAANFAGLKVENLPNNTFSGLVDVAEVVKYGAEGALAGAIKRPERTPDMLMNEARKLTTEILQPPTPELRKSISRGKNYPAVEEAMKLIKKSKDFKELKNTVDNEIPAIFNERNEILKSKNFKVKKDYISNLENYIAQAKAKGQSTPQEIAQMERVLGQEKAHFLSKGEAFDRLYAQGRKEYLQELTKGYLTKMPNGAVLDTQTGRTQALNILRQGLKESVEGNDSTVILINKKYEGLLRARDLIANQQALVEKAIPQSKVQDLIDLIGRSPTSIAANMARAAYRNAQGLPKKTAKIEKLYNEANKKTKIPEFKNTKEAIEFGIRNKNNPLVIQKLMTEYDNKKSLTKELELSGKLEEAFISSQKAQFPREALEAALGKIKNKNRLNF